MVPTDCAGLAVLRWAEPIAAEPHFKELSLFAILSAISFSSLQFLSHCRRLLWKLARKAALTGLSPKPSVFLSGYLSFPALWLAGTDWGSVFPVWCLFLDKTPGIVTLIHSLCWNTLVLWRNSFVLSSQARSLELSQHPVGGWRWSKASLCFGGLSADFSGLSAARAAVLTHHLSWVIF